MQNSQRRKEENGGVSIKGRFQMPIPTPASWSIRTKGMCKSGQGWKWNSFTWVREINNPSWFVWLERYNSFPNKAFRMTSKSSSPNSNRRSGDGKEGSSRITSAISNDADDNETDEKLDNDTFPTRKISIHYHTSKNALLQSHVCWSNCIIILQQPHLLNLYDQCPTWTHKAMVHLRHHCFSPIYWKIFIYFTLRRWGPAHGERSPFLFLQTSR